MIRKLEEQQRKEGVKRKWKNGRKSRIKNEQFATLK